jgi:ribosome-binding factor A
MARDRTERAQQALRDAAAEFVARNAGPQSLITITRAEMAPNFTRVKFFLSVLPEEKEEAALGLLTRTIPELKKYLEEHIRLPRIPHVEYLIDRGEKNRQRLDSLS